VASRDAAPSFFMPCAPAAARRRSAYVRCMARSIWSGAISFGLVNIPVKLFSATESHRVAFHEFEEGTGQRIHHKRVAERSGREVPWNKIRKGFEVGKGRYVVLTDEELRSAEPHRTSVVDIEQFVALNEIDPINWEQTYYLGPDGASAVKAYALLRRAMTEQQRVAIGRFVMRTKEHLVCIRPFEEILALETMYFPDEIRSPKEIAADVRKVAVNPRELTMAEQLIESLTAPWDPKKHQDTFSKRVLELVRKKDKGQEIAVAPAGEEAGGGEVIDLMEALKATLAGGRGQARGQGARRPAPARGRPRAARGKSRAARAKPRAKAHHARRPRRRRR
jgi:DNA end-binding protein Ku